MYLRGCEEGVWSVSGESALRGGLEKRVYAPTGRRIGVGAGRNERKGNTQSFGRALKRQGGIIRRR